MYLYEDTTVIKNQSFFFLKQLQVFSIYQTTCQISRVPIDSKEKWFYKSEDQPVKKSTYFFIHKLSYNDSPWRDKQWTVIRYIKVTVLAATGLIT